MAGLPALLNDWEQDVLLAELARPSFVAWYRNPQRATPNSLRIPYEDERGRWASLQPDFLIISRRDDSTLAASLVDPHGDHLADAKVKLRALAVFAEEHGSSFLRIQSIAKGADGSLRVLDLSEAGTRAAIRAFEGGKISALYEGSHASVFQ
jgi:hypothetical protein